MLKEFTELRLKLQKIYLFRISNKLHYIYYLSKRMMHNLFLCLLRKNVVMIDDLV